MPNYIHHDDRKVVAGAPATLATIGLLLGFWSGFACSVYYPVAAPILLGFVGCILGAALGVVLRFFARRK